jgi:hypothetical protein
VSVLPFPPVYDLPEEVYPFTLEARFVETGKLAWIINVEKPAPGKKVVLRIPGKDESGGPVTITARFANGEVLDAPGPKVPKSRPSTH